MSAPRSVDYPPERHLLRALEIVFEPVDGHREIVAPLSPALRTDRGSLALGPAAVLADIVAGGIAVESVSPDWAVTSDMTIRLLQPCSEGLLRGRSRALRVGKGNVVLEVELVVEPSGTRVALAQLGFTRVERRADTLRLDPGERPEEAIRFANVRSRFGPEGTARGFYEELGVREVDGNGGVLEIDVAPYQRNSVGALQGGVVVALAERAAQAMARGLVGEPWVTTDLTAHYLAMGRSGPVRSSGELVRRDEFAVTSRIELRDCGADDRLLAVVTAMARSFGGRVAGTAG